MSNSLHALYESRPYLVVIHSGFGLSAVYNRHYKLLFESASERLLAYAAQWNTGIQQGFTLTQPDQQPTWMQYGLKEEYVCYFLYKDFASERELRAIPAR